VLNLTPRHYTKKSYTPFINKDILGIPQKNPSARKRGRETSQETSERAEEEKKTEAVETYSRITQDARGTRGFFATPLCAVSTFHV
jgi:ribosome-binding protein aMBF1 (putative translation factor)